MLHQDADLTAAHSIPRATVTAVSSQAPGVWSVVARNRAGCGKVRRVHSRDRNGRPRCVACRRDDQDATDTVVGIVARIDPDLPVDVIAPCGHRGGEPARATPATRRRPDGPTAPRRRARRAVRTSHQPRPAPDCRPPRARPARSPRRLSAAVPRRRTRATRQLLPPHRTAPPPRAPAQPRPIRHAVPLSTELPAALLARMLGFEDWRAAPRLHVTVTVAWQCASAGDWLPTWQRSAADEDE